MTNAKIRPNRRPRRRFHKRSGLSVEHLEHRRMMATFSVTNLLDAGPGSLRDAITLANADAVADTIEFDVALAGGTIALTSGQLEVTESLTLHGLGASQLTVDAEGRSRVFRFDDNNGADFLSVELDGLTVTGGHAYGGAGISSRENLTLNDVVVMGNTTTDDFAGGAGIFHAFGELTINDSTISNNTVSGNNGDGGGLYVGFDTVHITNSTISGNAALGADAKGGGIYSAGATLSIENSTIESNRASGERSVGGGIAASPSSSVEIQNSSISNNLSLGSGGGVHANGNVTMTDSTVEDNRSYEYGGGLRLGDQNVQISITRSSIAGNTATGSGGGISANAMLLTTTETDIIGNVTLDTHGGGIWFYGGGSLSVTGGRLAGNHASVHGGGVYHVDGELIVTRATIAGNAGGGVTKVRGRATIDDSTISANAALVAGGVGLAGTEQATITNSTISGNLATVGGGAILHNYGTLLLQNSTVTLNEGPADLGGGILGYPGAVTEIRSSIIAGNLNSDFAIVGPTLESPFISDGHNVVGFGNGIISFANDIRGVVDPGLEPLADNGGPTMTHALLPDSPAINNGSNGLELLFDQRGAPFARVADGLTDSGAFELQAATIDGDFNDDGDYSCGDIDGLIAEIVAGSNDPLFDLTADGTVDTADLDAWLAEAGAAELPSGNPYLFGDANLDGAVEGLDFVIWNANKFTSVPAWCAGDFNADGSVDGLDFVLWNANKFTSADRQAGSAIARQTMEDADQKVAVESPAADDPHSSAPIPMAVTPQKSFGNDRSGGKKMADDGEASHTVIDALFAMELSIDQPF